LVITHHPLIFKSLKSIDLNSFEGKVIACALKSQTAVFAAHTNLDSAADGINDVLADRIGLQETEPLLAAAHDDGGDTDPAAPIGLGRIGRIAAPMPVKQWVRQLKKRLGLAHVKTAGNLDRTIHRVAVCSGSGSSLMDTFLSSDADVYVSGDLRYHDARTVEDRGRVFIDIGHFASEHLIIDPLVRKLKAAVEATGWDIAIEPCAIESDPFSIM
jgi:dinuclear metal center YbgI/SA1388 family protein